MSQDVLNNTNVVNQNIVDEMKKSYINYAMSVIVARALPDSRDGLKPVQRRILYTMYKMGIMPGSQHKKVARIVGETMGKYHPHGDSSISDALVRMGQDFSMRYCLINGQGNFGSIDGDPAAAMRYIEARLDKYGLKLLEDLDRSTVDMLPNYDGNEIEPAVLPGLLPNLLVNGGEGIAVGMATKLPPHNISEVIDGIQHVIKYGNKWDGANDENFSKIEYSTAIKSFKDIESLPKNRFPFFNSDIAISELVKYIKAPDFPSECEIYDTDEIKKVYETGKGRILMRGIVHTEETKTGRYRIIITKIPYQVNKAVLIAKIADLHKEKKIEGIVDLRDESNREGIRVVIDLKKDAIPKTIENQLFKYTELQKTFSANMLALVNGEPELLNLRKIIEIYLTHRQEIVVRRSEHELAKFREREHILEGLLKAISNIDEVIKIIRNAESVESAKEKLIKKFELSDIQAQAILDMQLRRLAALEIKALEEEYKLVLDNISKLIDILSNNSKLLDIISDELSDLKAKLGDSRKCKIFKSKPGDINVEDVITNEETLITISKQGYIKRTPVDTYQLQKRGGVGKKAITTKEDDSVRHIFKTNTHDEILFFSNKGKVYALRAYEVPEYSRTAKGLPLVNLIQLSPNELVTSVITRDSKGNVVDEDIAQENEVKTESNTNKPYQFLFMATLKGIVKKTSLSDFGNIRSNGLIAINLDPADELIWVKPTRGEDHIFIITTEAKSIHFNEKDVRETGRSSRGVRGIKLKEGNKVISMDVIRKNEEFVLTVSESGYGKLSEISEFTLQNRGGTGIFAARINKKTGKIACARLLDHPNLELLILSAQGQAVKIPTKDLPVQSRQTAGVRLMKIKEDDKVAAIAIV